MCDTCKKTDLQGNKRTSNAMIMFIVWCITFLIVSVTVVPLIVLMLADRVGDFIKLGEKLMDKALNND